MRSFRSLVLPVLLLASVLLPLAHAGAAGTRCASRLVTVDLAAGQHPTAHADVILGTPGDDVIRAGRGADLVCGQGGGDDIFGGRGADRVYGQAGDDHLRGGGGNDRLYGGKGGDFTGGNAGNDLCDLGPGPGDEGDPTCESGSGS